MFQNTLQIYIIICRLTYTVVEEVVVVRAMNVLKAEPRGSLLQKATYFKELWRQQ